MATELYIDDVLNTTCQVRRIVASYVRPWEAEIFCPCRHDQPVALHLWDEVQIDVAGTTRFRGNIVETVPGGVAEEGITFVARGKRFRLENEPVRVNGRGFYVWNRRGHLCNEGQGGEDSPGNDGGKWTAGEIVIDILEHALGIPGVGSDIGGHHGDACCVTATYLTASEIAGYSGAAWLARDSMVGEFSVDNTSVADAISLLLALNGGFYGWYISPATGNLILVNLDGLATTDIQAGELGHWQDEGGTDYRLLDNRLEWSLEGVATTIVIQGTDETTEEQPANIEGSANPGQGDLGELELVAAPWKGFPAAYRPLCQPKRHPTSKQIDPGNVYTPPVGFLNFGHGPRVYEGTDAGAKLAYHPGGAFPRWLLVGGLIGFYVAPALGPGVKLWGWYWAKVPFLVQAGPVGDAYHCYGYQRTRTVYDPAFRHTTSYPQPGTADDETAMGILATRLLRLYRDVRRSGTLICDQVDFATFHLRRRYDVVNLGALALGLTTEAPAPTSSTGCPHLPTAWDELEINAVEVTYDFTEETTAIRVANTFFMLEEYSELKRRLEMNLFAQRELDLSEEVVSCSVQDSDTQEDEAEAATTEAPGTTAAPTTEGPTTPGPTTPGPTTPQPTTEKPGPSTSTTEEPGPSTSTTEEPGPTTSTTEKPGPTTSTTEEPGPTTSTTEEPGPTTEEPGPGPTTEEPGPTTTEEPGPTTSTTKGPTTTSTTSSTTSTTSDWVGCNPSYCDECPDTYHVAISIRPREDTCVVACTVEMDYDENCLWEGGGLGCWCDFYPEEEELECYVKSASLECEPDSPNVWKLRIGMGCARQGGAEYSTCYCEWTKAVHGCPAGTYTLVDEDCTSCGSEVTVYDPPPLAQGELWRTEEGGRTMALTAMGAARRAECLRCKSRVTIFPDGRRWAEFCAYRAPGELETDRDKWVALSRDFLDSPDSDCPAGRWEDLVPADPEARAEANQQALIRRQIQMAGPILEVALAGLSDDEKRPRIDAVAERMNLEPEARKAISDRLCGQES